MEQFVQAESAYIVLLLVASLVAIVVRRLRVPYTVALVLVGLLFTFEKAAHIEVTPELILTLFLPPLVFEAAFHLNLDDLRRMLATILVLAVPGVLLTMLIVGAVLAYATGLPLSIALIFGAIMAATDPVAVVAMFRALGVPKRLGILLEGESLLNDGTAIVIYTVVLAAVGTGEFSATQGVLDFLSVSLGGAMVGVVLGMVTNFLISRVDDYLIETSLTTVLAFGSYLLADQLQFSGVLAVVAAGLVNGTVGPRGMSPTTRIVLFNFWEYAAFLANSLVFLLIGSQVNVPAIVGVWPSVVWAIVAVFIARVVVVYGLSWLVGLLVEPVPMRWQHVLTWGGLRGAVGLALALGLPGWLGPERDLLRIMTFGVVLFTLLVQGTTMSLLLRRLGLRDPRSTAQVEYERRHARLAAARAGLDHLRTMHQQGLLSTHTWETLEPIYTARMQSLADGLRETVLANPRIAEEEIDTAQREALRAERASLQSLQRDGVITDHVYEELVIELDQILDEERLPLPNITAADSYPADA